MSTLTSPKSTWQDHPAPGGSSFSAVVRSELTKLRTVRSTFWSLFVTVLLGIGLVALIGALTSYRVLHPGPDGGPPHDPTIVAGIWQVGITLGSVALAVMAIIAVTGEYATGMIRSSLTAVPQRMTFLVAKTLVVGLIALVVGEAVAFIGFYVLVAEFRGVHLAPHLSDPGQLRAVIGAGLYLTVIALMALGLGGIIRHTAGSIVTIFLLLFILPIMTGLLPSPWDRYASHFFPGSEGSQVFSITPSPQSFGTWGGFMVAVAWAVGAIIVWAVMLRSRDA